ncbi:MAG: alpha/beta hydrolase [Beijerinckiaceae bacterium]|nr:alpha/beta hydrolase [Beijerinckiaceae bacterium]
MPFSTATGVKIYYEVAGQGPPLVFVHANPFDRRLWTYQVARFSQQFTTINIDIRGYGFSGKPETPFTLEDMADDIAGVMQSEGVARAVIAGCSVGSGIALLFGLERPQMVEGLILVGGSSRGGGNIQNRIDGYTSGDLAGYRRKHMTELFAPGFPQTPHGEWVMNLFDENSHTLSGECIAQIFRARAGCNMTPRLHGISAPTLVINGAHDVSLAAGAETAAGVRGARQVVIANTGHACSIEDPRAFDAAMIGFLRDVGKWT